MMIEKVCQQCSQKFSVPHWRKDAKFCGINCRHTSQIAEPNATCDQCKKDFHLKKSQVNRYARNLGIFCSTVCCAKAKSEKYAGENNPNYKGKNTDSDGYRIYVPQASLTLLGLGKMKLHQAVACEILGISRMPVGFHLHHRDCNILNNDPLNLAILSMSNHKWIHKQFGIATLWAIYHRKLDIDEAVSWSDDPNRAKFLLMQNLIMQGQIVNALNVDAENKVSFIANMKMPVRCEFIVEEAF